MGHSFGINETEVGVKGSTNGANSSGVAGHVRADGPIYCFFRLPYSSKRPLPGPFSLRTYELSHNLPLGTGIKGYRRDGNLVTNLRMLV